MSDVKQYYYMVAGQILYQAEGQEGPGLATVNTLVMTPDVNVTMHQVGRAQQGLQIQFMNKLPPDVKVEIMDVVILGFTVLGFMTDAEFRAVPEVVVSE